MNLGINKMYKLLNKHIADKKLEDDIALSVEIQHKGSLYVHFPIHNTEQLLLN